MMETQRERLRKIHNELNQRQKLTGTMKKKGVTRNARTTY